MRSEHEDGAERHLRHVHRFLRAAAHFAVAAMATHDSEPVLPATEPQASGKSPAARRLPTEAPSSAESNSAAAEHSAAVPSRLQEAAEAAQAPGGTPKARRSAVTEEGTEAAEPSQLFQRQPIPNSMQVGHQLIKRLDDKQNSWYRRVY